MAISDQIHTYTETDTGGTASDLLNLATQSTRDAIDDVEAIVGPSGATVADHTKQLAAATADNTANTLVKRSAVGAIGVQTVVLGQPVPAGDAHAASKAYVDSGSAVATAVNGATPDVVGSTLVKRNAEGVASVQALVLAQPVPGAAAHAASRQYVDSRDSWATLSSQVNVPANGTVNVVITLPAGKFTNPIPIANSVDSACFCAITARSATSVTVTFRNVTATAANLNRCTITVTEAA